MLHFVDSSEQTTTANGEPAMTVQETKIDQPGEGVAVIGEPVFLENSSELKLLREESRESNGAGESQLVDRGVLNPISEEVAADNYPDTAAPYLVSCNTVFSRY